MMRNVASTETEPGGRMFPNTRWSVVLTASQPASMESAAALEALCRAYWYPLYVLARSSGRSPEDAQDLTQEFFARLLAKEYLRDVDREKGRFRTFLRVAFKRFMADQWDRTRAQKRGGGVAALSLDTALAEQRYAGDFADRAAPDQLYERRWALALLDEVAGRLEAEYEADGKRDEIRMLKPHLTATRGEIPYREIAESLSISEGAARVAVHRLRKRFREIFRETVADTVSDAKDVEEEMRWALEALSR